MSSRFRKFWFMTPVFLTGNLIQIDAGSMLQRVLSEDVADEIGSGSITVNVWDNRVESNQWVEMYKNGKLVDTVYIKGSKTFEDLGFGDYKFVVVKNDDWNTQFTDAVPCQGDFDFDEGTVELSANLNTINYVIWGDDETVDTDPYGDTTDTGSGDIFR